MSDLEILLEQSPDEINLFVNNHPVGEVGAIYLQRHISMRPAVQLLELKGSTIGPKGAEYLASALSKHKSLRHLGLARNGINTSGAQAIFKALLGSQCIETVDVEWNCLQDPAAIALAKLIESTNSLVAVTLERNDIRCEGVAALASVLATNRSLRNLNLGFNKIATQGAARLGEMLAVNSTLLTLNLAMNGIYPDGARTLAEGLTANTTLRSLNLQSNMAIDAFADLGAAGVMRYSSAVKELNFSSNRLQSPLAVGFAAGLRTAKGLIAISLAKCAIGEPAITPVLEALSTLVSLVTVDISQCGLSAASATLIATLLSSCPSVRSLYMDDNRVESTGGEIIGEAIARSSALTVLSMNGCLIGPDGVRAIADSLRSRRGLPVQELRLAHNQMGDDALYILGDVLNMRMGEGECALEALDISGNNLTGRSCSSLARVLKLHAKLASVTIRDNKLCEELGGISFLTLDRAIAYAGKDVLNRVQSNSNLPGAPGSNSSSGGYAQGSGDASATAAAAAAAVAAAAVYSNFNGTSAVFMGSLATVDPGAMPPTATAKQRSTSAFSTHKLLPPDHHDAAALKPRRPSPIRQLGESVPESNALTIKAKVDASSHQIAASMREEIVPGLAPSLQVTKYRTQLHDVDNNVMLLPMNETQLRLKFTEFDTQCVGYLDANEFAVAYHRMDLVAVDPTGKRAKRLVKELAKDGKIYFEQFSVLMLRLINS